MKVELVREPVIYTGDIVDEVFVAAQEYTAVTQEISFTDEQHAIWTDLFSGVYRPHLMAHLCREFIQGLALLQLDPHHIPTWRI